MKYSIRLSSEELRYIQDDGRRIIIRPQSGKFREIGKGDILEVEGIDLLVLDVREYPTIEDLAELEKEAWMSIKAKTDAEARDVLKKKYSKEAKKVSRFLAIEFAPQE